MRADLVPIGSKVILFYGALLAKWLVLGRNRDRL